MYLHSKVGAPVIYIPRLSSYCKRASNIHSWARILPWLHQRYTFQHSRPTMGTPSIYIPYSRSTEGAPTIYIPAPASYSGRTNDIYPWTCILQWARRRDRSLDSHPIAGAQEIYIPGHTFYSRHTSDVHSLACILYRAHQRYTFLEWAH